ncbi:hypothetical protein FOXB_11614 [Fusarium oxysporum f. sp. conglutinans Fo5176]|uniref:Uncharacterized protein n=1 Tax=Fusarium oxysporum (strain Fo5176) TaxID=660025 RepID=F9FYY2_FUSOF|nr:hypothetical protein FOXB_11614 [Fusarium oxysporum f. sp. conglutinans Fo5176]
MEVQARDKPNGRMCIHKPWNEAFNCKLQIGN